MITLHLEKQDVREVNDLADQLRTVLKGTGLTGIAAVHILYAETIKDEWYMAHKLTIHTPIS